MPVAARLVASPAGATRAHEAHGAECRNRYSSPLRGRKLLSPRARGARRSELTSGGAHRLHLSLGVPSGSAPSALAPSHFPTPARKNLANNSAGRAFSLNVFARFLFRNAAGISEGDRWVQGAHRPPGPLPRARGTRLLRRGCRDQYFGFRRRQPHDPRIGPEGFSSHHPGTLVQRSIQIASGVPSHSQCGRPGKKRPFLRQIRAFPALPSGLAFGFFAQSSTTN